MMPQSMIGQCTKLHVIEMLELWRYSILPDIGFVYDIVEVSKEMFILNYEHNIFKIRT